MTVERTADELISQAVRLGVTDVHITPRRKDYMIKFRLHGHLIPRKPIPPIAGERLISHLKFMASMDISEKRKPQSGAWQHHCIGNQISLRISTLPTAHSKESLVIRIIPQKQSFSLGKMSLFPKSIQQLYSMMSLAHGMIIFTGPAGSGKTTTIYTLAEYCSKRIQRNMITLEDPVERQNDLFLQVQVNEKAGITYHTGLKAILRHDPDIIFIGEIRDAETAKIAIRAAMTGHLVLTSMHTRNAEGAVYRLLEFGVKPLEIEQTVVGVTAQRLVSLFCPFCRGGCSEYCRRNGFPKRAAVFDLVHGQMLRQIINTAQKGERVKRSRTLESMIRKGIALGYISQEEYKRWIVEEREEAEAERTGNLFDPYSRNDR